MSRIRPVLATLARLAITAGAFAWIFRTVDLASLRAALGRADPGWLAAAVAIFFLAQWVCIERWRLLVPPHPALTRPFLTRSFFVACFFNSFLPTTVGGDVVRGYDLIKATGEWRGSLASILVDRLLGLTGFLAFALISWFTFSPAREDPVIRSAFLGFCGLVAVTFAVLGSRRILGASLRPFGKIGLGQLQSHARQFQESLLAYLRQPRRLLAAFGVGLGVQFLAIGTFAALSNALHLPVPLAFLIIVVPIVMTLSQLPISLSGWGIREGATIFFFSRIGVGAAEALSLSFLSGGIPLLSAAVGAILFLTKRKRR